MPTRNPLTAYAARPLNTFLEVQDPAEEIELLLRRHVVVNIPWILAVIILAAAPFVLLKFSTNLINTFPPLNLLKNLNNTQVGILQLLYYLIVFYIALTQFMQWFFNVLVVTNKRIFDVDFRAPLHRNISEAQLEEVQDARFNQSGFGAVLFDFGNIFIQTAGQRQDIELFSVPNPAQAHDEITDLLDLAPNQ